MVACLPQGQILLRSAFPPERCYMSWRGPYSMVIDNCRGSRRTKPGSPAALGGRAVTARATRGWGEHKVGTNPSAPMTSQGSSTSQPKTRKFPKAGYILPGLGPELPPYLNHPQPAWGIAGLIAACQHCSICSQISVFQEKLFLLCFPQDNGVKV